KRRAAMRAKTGRIAASTLTVILAMVWVTLASAQTFKKIAVTGGAKMTHIAAGSASVWALSTTGKPYVYENGKFTQASTVSLTQIAVGGGSLRQADAVWGLDAAGRIYRGLKNGTSYTFGIRPGILSHIAVGIGYEDSCHPYEVWGLNPSALIFRFDFCLKNWEQIPGTLQSISVGGGDVYGVNGNFEVYRFNFQTHAFVWLSTRDHANQISPGSNGAWALDTEDLVREYNRDRDVFDYVFVPEHGVARFASIQGGGDGVWALDPNGRIYQLRRGAWMMVGVGNLEFA